MDLLTSQTIWRVLPEIGKFQPAEGPEDEDPSGCIVIAGSKTNCIQLYSAQYGAMMKYADINIGLEITKIIKVNENLCLVFTKTGMIYQCKFI